jgi:HEAT repeat protein
MVAATTLSEIGATAKEAVPALAGLLDDEDALLRSHAVHCLGEYGGAPELVTPAFVKALVDESEDVRHQALLQIGRVDVEPRLAGPVLFRCFETWQGEDRLLAGNLLWRLSFIPSSLLPRLARLLDDEDPEVRELALLSLEGLDGEWQDAVAPVVARLSDISPRVRLAAADRLARWDRREADAFPVALALATATDGDPGLRESAVLVLGRLPDDPKGRGLAVIVEALTDESRSMRSAAVLSLRWVRELPEEALPLLIEALADPDDEVRLEAAWALGVHGVQVDGVVRALVDLLGSENWSVPCNAATALGEIGPPARGAVPALAKLQTAESEFLREVATKALKAIRADEE